MKRLVAFVMLLALGATTLISPAKASLGLFGHLSSLVTTPISIGVSTVRGALSTGLHSTNTLSDQFPSILTPITMPVGMVFGTGFGGVAGAIKGLDTGLTAEPLTAESLCLDGEFLDYHPYGI